MYAAEYGDVSNVINVSGRCVMGNIIKKHSKEQLESLADVGSFTLRYATTEYHQAFRNTLKTTSDCKILNS